MDSEVSSMVGTYGRDNAFYYTVRCKVCGREESRKEYL